MVRSIPFVKSLGSLGLAFLLIGCGSDSNRSNRAPGAAIWLEIPDGASIENPGLFLPELPPEEVSGGDPPEEGASEGGGAESAEDLSSQAASELPPPGVLERLGTAGISDVFLPFGHLLWADDRPQVGFRDFPGLPEGSPATLVIQGRWRAPRESSAAAGTDLGMEILRAEAEARSMGLSPTGVHLELAVPRRDSALAELAEGLEACREAVSSGLFVSVGLPSSWLSKEGVGEVAAAADFLVGWIYGQRPRGLERAGIVDRRWSLAEVEKALGDLESLDTPYLVGIVSLATALRRDPSGEIQGVTHEGNFETLALSRAFEMASEFVLSGVDARRYDFEVRARDRFGPWNLESGETVSVVGLSPYLIREYSRRRQALDLPNYLGEIYFRLPTLSESYFLGLEGLEAALGSSSADDALVARVTEWEGRRSSHELRVSLENLMPEATEISTLEHNYLELTLSSGWFEGVSMGDFERYQLLRREFDGSLAPTLRQPDVLRLFRPVLGAGSYVESGIIEIRGHVESPPQLGGRFLLASGDFVEVAHGPPVEEEESAP